MVNRLNAILVFNWFVKSYNNILLLFKTNSAIPTKDICQLRFAILILISLSIFLILDKSYFNMPTGIFFLNLIYRGIESYIKCYHKRFKDVPTDTQIFLLFITKSYNIISVIVRKII